MPQATVPPTPLQTFQLTEEDFKDPKQFLGMLNRVLTDHAQLLNYLRGFSGPVSINNHLDLGGNRLQGVGEPIDPTDAVSHVFATSKYGADALRPQFEALGKSVMQSYRQLSNKVQRERYSSFLNNVKNTAPTANTSQIIQTGPIAGGFAPITVTAGLHQHVDGSVVPYAAFNDSLAVPASFAITSLSRSGNVVTATLPVATTAVAGNGITVGNAPDPSFDGAFVILSVTGGGFTITYSQIGPNASTGASIYCVNGVYYYTITVFRNVLSRVQALSGVDSWTERAAASPDGTTIIAVALMNFTGLDQFNSAAGATPPVSGASIPVIRRL